MATIPSVNYSRASAPQTVTPVTPALTANVLEYKPTARQTLYIQNGSGAPINVTLKGSAAPAAYQCPGTLRTEDLTTGSVVAVAAGAIRAIPLLQAAQVLQGNATVDFSAVTTVTCWLVED